MSSSVTDIVLESLRNHLGNHDVGHDDDFYAMGGDSLIALRVVTDLRDRGLGITLRDLLYHPSASGLAAAAEALQAGPVVDEAAAPAVPFGLLAPGDRAMVPDGVVDALPASALQVGMIYMCEASDDPRLYRSLMGWEVRGRFDENLFRRALGDLCDRHPALRSSFDLGSFSVATQLVWSRVAAPLTVEALGERDIAKADEHVRRWREQQLSQPLDWRRAPLLRCHVVALPESFHVALSTHHAIVDGWSYGRLILDLLTIYDALARGEGADLPPLPPAIQRAFLVAERDVLGSQESADHWQAEADVPTLLFDRGRFGAVPSAVGHVEFDVDEILVKRLRDAAQQVGVSLKALVLGVHSWALGRWTGRDSDVVTGVVVNTRPEQPGSDLVVGLYLNTLPIRSGQLGGTWANLARRARAAELRAARHSAYPLAAIEHRLGRSAFDVAFNFTNFHVYRDLDELTELRARSWWVYGKPSFPFRIDFEVEGAQAGTRVVIDFDPDMVEAERVRGYADIYEAALAAAAADPNAMAELAETRGQGSAAVA
jgi:aryl carrier-like protein